MENHSNTLALKIAPSQIENKKAVIIARVSSKEQLKGFSLEAQKEILYDYAKKWGYDVVEVFEFSESGSRKKERVKFDNAIRYIRENNITNLLIEKTDRLYRNFGDLHKLEQLRDQADLRIHLVKEHEILDKESNSHANTLHAVKVLFAKQFLDNLREEIQKGCAIKAKKGLPQRGCYGYEINYKTKEMNVCPKQREIVKRLFKLYATGKYSTGDLATFLNNAGHKTSKGNFFGAPSVYHILKNPTYHGEFFHQGELYKGSYEPIIDYELFAKCQILTKSKSRPSKIAYDVNTRFILYPLLYSEKGKKLARLMKQKSDDKATRYDTYHLDINNQGKRMKVCFSEKKLYRRIDRFMCSMAWSKEDEAKAKQKIERVAFKAKQATAQNNISFVDEIKKAEKCKSRLLSVYVKGVISEPEFIKERLDLDKQIDKYRTAISLLRQIKQRAATTNTNNIREFTTYYNQYEQNLSKKEKANILSNLFERIELSTDKKIKLVPHNKYSIFIDEQVISA